MRELCLDEGTLQGYLDGELSLDMMEAVAEHLAACEACDMMAREAESELNIFNAACAPELAVHVPTEQLRVRLNAAIDELQPPAQPFRLKDESRLRGWLNGLAASFNFGPQRAVGFASLIAVIAFAMIFSIIYSRRTTPVNPGAGEAPVAQIQTGPQRQVNTGITETPGKTGPQLSDAGTTNVQEKNPAQFSKVVYQPRRKFSATPLQPSAEKRPGNISEAGGTVAKNSVEEKLLPGEKNYLKTIASLTTAIQASGDAVLKPTLRAEYERNLAVVDQAIAAVRPVARRKPGDENATRFLYSAYQSKIDLLSAVADQQNQLVAMR